VSAEQLRLSTVEGIVTPEAVVLELDIAGLASRVFAGLLDLLVALAVYLVGSILVLFGTAGFDSSSRATAQYVLLTAVLIGYPLLSQTLMRGATIGKRALGLRAVTLEGAPIRFRHAALRTMGGLVDLLVPPGGITGMLFVLGTRRHQSVADLLAGTVVIRDPARTALPPALWFPVPWGLDPFAATIDPTAMTVEQYTVVRAFLVRMRELAPDGRAVIAADLAGRVAATVQHPWHRQVHPEAFLLCAIARYQRRNFPAYQPGAGPPPPPPPPFSAPPGRGWS
jgi:uncharacterized RDD family membrane protein YckC